MRRLSNIESGCVSVYEFPAAILTNVGVLNEINSITKIVVLLLGNHLFSIDIDSVQTKQHSSRMGMFFVASLKKQILHFPIHTGMLTF